MLHGFLHNKITTPEEYLIGLEMRQGQPISIDHSILDMPIKFDNNEIDAFILDAVDGRLVIQLLLPLKMMFDADSNVYEVSFIRKLLNSDSFLSRFNEEFAGHIKKHDIHTEDYVTHDKLWLLSHEEMNQNANFLRSNSKCHSFELFKSTDIRSYSKMLLSLNDQNCFGWRLRSAYSATTYDNYDMGVGFVNNNGYIDFSTADNEYYGALCPACAIC